MTQTRNFTIDFFLNDQTTGNNVFMGSLFYERQKDLESELQFMVNGVYGATHFNSSNSGFIRVFKGWNERCSFTVKGKPISKIEVYSYDSSRFEEYTNQAWLNKKVDILDLLNPKK